MYVSQLHFSSSTRNKSVDFMPSHPRCGYLEKAQIKLNHVPFRELNIEEAIRIRRKCGYVSNGNHTNNSTETTRTSSPTPTTKEANTEKQDVAKERKGKTTKRPLFPVASTDPMRHKLIKGKNLT